MTHARKLALLSLLLLTACAGTNSPRPGDDPLLSARRADLTAGQRVEAIEQAEARVESGQADRLVTRYALKELAWDLNSPELVRAAALEAVLWDEAETEDSRELVTAMLPTEPGRACVAVMATAAADHGWTEATPALVRSLARSVPAVELTDRSEFQALRALHPAQELNKVAMAVFLDPQVEKGPTGLRLDMRAREAAWDLIGRLTPDPTARAPLLATDAQPDEEGQAILSDLQRLHASLGVVPATGEEIRWALRLVEQRDTRLAAWWSQAESAIAQIPAATRSALELRHLEPARWAGQNNPAWLTATRESLLAQLDSRLAGRQVYARLRAIEGLANANAERFALARDQLSWGDALALLVVDAALSTPSVQSQLFATAEIDNDDTATEHGGTLWADADGFHAQHFPPRGSPSPDDRRFVAPREMLDYSAAALAHFHFHVADWRNRDYAGPSPQDLGYAHRLGRTCVVFTGISRGVLNADVYFPDGTVVDLGEIRAPGA